MVGHLVADVGYLLASIHAVIYSDWRRHYGSTRYPTLPGRRQRVAHTHAVQQRYRTSANGTRAEPHVHTVAGLAGRTQLTGVEPTVSERTLVGLDHRRAQCIFCAAGIVVPSSLLTYQLASWAHARRTRIGIKAFKAGLTPVVIALLVAAAILIAQGIPVVNGRLPQIALTVLAAVLVWRTQLHLLWLIAGGALAGALGWV